MERLREYIYAHTDRGECQCGKCFDKGPDRDPATHSVNVHFFWVSAVGSPQKEELEALLVAEYPCLDRLKNGPSYIEIGGQVGSQELALRLIGLGAMVGLWQAVTPATLSISGPEANWMAEAGLVMAGGF